MRKPRKARPKQKNVPKGYDSRWEYDIHKSILKKESGVVSPLSEETILVVKNHPPSITKPCLLILVYDKYLTL